MSVIVQAIGTILNIDTPDDVVEVIASDTGQSGVRFKLTDTSSNK
jgi:hypothetical protein